MHPVAHGLRVTFVGIVANILRELGKAAARIFGHSYPLMADAIESGTDVFSSLLVYVGHKIAAKPPDEVHP